MEILHEETIDVGLLIARNIKYMDDAPQKDLGSFLCYQWMCRLVGVPIHPDDLMVSPMLLITTSFIRKTLNAPHPVIFQEE